MKLRGVRFFVNWIFTLLIGSVLAPIVFYLFIGLMEGFRPSASKELSEMYLLVSGISFILSGLISLPSFVIWIITLSIIKRRNSMRSVLKKMQITHFITYFLTIAVAGIVIFLLEGRRDLYTVYPMFALVVTYYMLIGVMVWFVRMRKFQQFAQKQMPDDEDVLDVFV